MKQWQRLQERGRFQAIFDQGRTYSSSLLVLKALPNQLGYSRCGFAVGKRLGNAVLRNRMRRRLRECVAGIPLGGGWDVVFIARQGVATVDFGALREAATELVKKARLLGDRI